MDITLIIPAHNEEDWIGQCLDSVQRYAPGGFTEVIVVDNASTDSTARIAAQKGARVVREERKGLTRARQSGLDVAATEYVAYIDADCLLTPNWFSMVEYHHRKHPNFVSLTGPVTYYDGPAYLRFVVRFLEWVILPSACFMAGYIIIGGNFVARRDALIAVGGFDPDVAFYGEDADIARRLAKVGYVLLRMNLVVQTSARRLQREGVVTTYVRYAANFLSHVVFHRSLSKQYTDVRT